MLFVLRPAYFSPTPDPSVGALNTVERETPQFLRVIYMVGEFSVDFLSSGFQVFVFVFFSLVTIPKNFTLVYYNLNLISHRVNYSQTCGRNVFEYLMGKKDAIKYAKNRQVNC